MLLKSINKEITLLPYSRGIAKQVNEKLLDGVMAKSEWGQEQMNMPVINIDRAEELAIQLVSGLTIEEMDALSIEDYNELKKFVDVNVKKNVPKK